MRVRNAILATLLAALYGCAGCDDVPEGAVQDCNPQVAVTARTDLLFVIDDSGSMAGEQAELAANLSEFIDTLLTTSAAALDLHVGVTNTSVTNYSGNPDTYGLAAGGDPFRGVPGTPYPAGAIVAIEQDPNGVGTAGHFLWGRQYDPANLTSTWGGLRMLSSGPTLAQDFKANVLQGKWGAGKEQPLRAMRLAVEKMAVGQVNAGFRRPGARLAVVFITDEDDCSESAPPYEGTSQTNCQSETLKFDGSFDPLGDFVTLLDTTVGGEPFVAVIAGFDPATPTLEPTGCSSGTSASLQPPTRFDAFLTRLDATHAGRTHKDSICRDYASSLAAIAEKLIPQRILLSEAPADYRMLVVNVVRADGSVTPCGTPALAGTPETATAPVVFTPPQAGAPASLSFQNACKLAGHDRVDLQIVCVR